MENLSVKVCKAFERPQTRKDKAMQQKIGDVAWASCGRNIFARDFDPKINCDEDNHVVFVAVFKMWRDRNKLTLQLNLE